MKRTPTATYRLQLNSEQTFVDALALVPYLHDLGISHLYSSPCLSTRKGSTHGYDIIDHNRLNPYLGGEPAFNALVDALQERGMGLIMDIVPNHMGVGSDNGWWMDVLEHGEASLYAGYFDIDWRRNNRVLQNKLLLPFLGDHYGEVLERGELQLVLNEQAGSFHVAYFEHRFPVDPRTWSQILGHLVADLLNEGESAEAVVEELRRLIAELRSLPRRAATSRARQQQRRQRAQACKTRLARLCEDAPLLLSRLRRVIEAFNGRTGQGASFDRLHRLLESQAYRLAYWKVAADEINYRRFFDINDLAGLRQEDDEVFQITHRLIARLAAEGRIDGVRVDHVDGLSDPSAYCLRLQHLLNDKPEPHCFIYLEKILAVQEDLPPTWPVDGTTGYEFGALVNGLFVHPDSQTALSRLYNRFAIPLRHKTGVVGRNFAGITVDFNELVYNSKKLIIQNALSGELSVLVNLLVRLAQADRSTRDFTANSLRTSLTEVVACFPVYRTYITSYRFSEHDRQYVQQALDEAARRNPGRDMEFEFIHGILVATPFSRHEVPRPPDMGRLINAFCLRFQQYTSMVEAKGLEDTACYRFNRLVSLNEVGFDPCAFGIGPAAFHAENSRRLEKWPHTLLSSSTHDSKRGEDVRTRIDVLSELTEEWKLHVLFWKSLNRRLRPRHAGQPLPSDNDEYLLYQTLLGAWPLTGEESTAEGMEDFGRRIEDYMIKAVREAKVHTSWSNPSETYEQGLLAFIRALLAPGQNPFLADFLPFMRRTARFGMLNSLSQTLFKLCVPGVPDIYQGNELFAFNLVDPDNRRPVDFARRRVLLDELEAVDRPGAGGERRRRLQQWADAPEDGRAKLFLTWLVLRFRRQYAELFTRGDYLPLAVEGGRAEHVVAFARVYGGKRVMVAAARWFARLNEHGYPAPEDGIWLDTWLAAPEGLGQRPCRNLVTDAEAVLVEREGRDYFNVQDLLSHFPVALLVG